MTLWDSGEFLAAAHSLGIPHPPGTPLYVLIGNLWGKAFSWIGGFAYALNLLSAAAGATSLALLVHMAAGWWNDTRAAFVAAIVAGSMASVWRNANETEVYALASLVSMLILFAGDNYRLSREPRWLLLAAYMTGLGWTLHPASLVSLPAAAYLAWNGRAPASFSRASMRRALQLLCVTILGASATAFMIVRARHDPFINQGNPADWSSLLDVITREQYQPAGILPRQAPLWLQFGNFIAYFDWQIALGLSPGPAPSWKRTPLTVLAAILAIVGARAHRQADRRSFNAVALLFLAAGAGLVLYLNLKVTPSTGPALLPAAAPREARERDYFFVLAFMCWGAWAAFGATRMLRSRLVVVFPLLPVLLNWTAVDRRRQPHAYDARRRGAAILENAPASAVILARGDNDVYPVWYLQQVNALRRDVTIVVVPMLGAAWYRDELARRHALLPANARTWVGTDRTIATIRANAHAQNRTVVEAGDLRNRGGM